ncbi:MAG: class I tRNA ligase family protein, partial [Elusimicrobiaceae bacterium]|nr:class I tRNA ligase family protein [Elusimicrobiaceae bacterium]
MAKNKYSHTVLLPKTDFPMRAGLAQKEPKILDFWKSINLYEAMLKKNERGKHFVLHDGPPYANGKIHIGHALDKTIKDIILKSRAMMGYYTPYVPGWDCHGLPIEQALLKELKQ